LGLNNAARAVLAEKSAKRFLERGKKRKGKRKKTKRERRVRKGECKGKR
jgi:hypothetical protein